MEQINHIEDMRFGEQPAEVEVVECFRSSPKKKYQDHQSELSDLKCTLENERKLHKRIIEESNKAIMTKDEKIQSLKITISKLEDHIIKQVRLQGDGDNRQNQLSEPTVPPSPASSNVRSKRSP
jgi:hypothetical protein